MIKKSIALVAVCLLGGAQALAKLPALSDEAKAKAAEAAVKTAHGNKVSEFLLCRSMNRTAAAYVESARKANKDVKPATATPDCVDPGPFVAPGAAPAPAVAAPAPAAKPAAKKT